MTYDPYTHPRADPAASTQWGQQPSGYSSGYYPPAPAEQPYYPAQQGYAPQPQPLPVVVNVMQNNSAPIVVRPRRVNHKLHGWLTFWTGGMWAPVWIYVANRKPKVYR